MNRKNLPPSSLRNVLKILVLIVFGMVSATAENEKKPAIRVEFSAASKTLDVIFEKDWERDVYLTPDGGFADELQIEQDGIIYRLRRKETVASIMKGASYAPKRLSLSADKPLSFSIDLDREIVIFPATDGKKPALAKPFKIRAALLDSNAHPSVFSEWIRSN
jgi:hypothetical protein